MTTNDPAFEAEVRRELAEIRAKKPAARLIVIGVLLLVLSPLVGIILFAATRTVSTGLGAFFTLLIPVGMVVGLVLLIMGIWRVASRADAKY